MKTRSKVIGCIVVILSMIFMALGLRSLQSYQISQFLRNNDLEFSIYFKGREFLVKTCIIGATCPRNSKILNQYALLVEDNFSETTTSMTFAGRIIKNIVHVGYEFRQPRFCSDTESEKACANFFAQYTAAKGLLSNSIMIGTYYTNLPKANTSIESYITERNELVSTIMHGQGIIVQAISLEPLKMTNEDRMRFVTEIETSLLKEIDNARDNL